MGYFVAHDQSHSYKLTEISKDEFTHYYSRSQIGKPLSPRHLFDGSNLKQHRNVKALSQNIKPLSPRKFTPGWKKSTLAAKGEHSHGLTYSPDKRKTISQQGKSTLVAPRPRKIKLATEEKHSREQRSSTNCFFVTQLCSPHERIPLSQQTKPLSQHNYSQNSTLKCV